MFGILNYKNGLCAVMSVCAMSLVLLGFSFKGREVNDWLVDSPSNMMNPISLSWSTNYHNVRHNLWTEAGLNAQKLTGQRNPVKPWYTMCCWLNLLLFCSY